MRKLARNPKGQNCLSTQSSMKRLRRASKKIS